MSTRALELCTSIFVLLDVNLAKLVQIRMEIFIWGNASFAAKKGEHWDINFYPVENTPKEQGTGSQYKVYYCQA